MTIIGGDIIASLTGGMLENTLIYTAPSGAAIESNLGARMFNTVDRIINKFGTDANLYVASGTYSAAEGKRTIAEEVSQGKKVIPPYPFKKELVDGDVIRIEDMQTGVAAKDLTLPIVDGLQLTVLSEVYTLVRHWPIIANNTVVLYLMQLRK